MEVINSTRDCWVKQVSSHQASCSISTIKVSQVTRSSQQNHHSCVLANCRLKFLTKEAKRKNGCCIIIGYGNDFPPHSQKNPQLFVQLNMHEGKAVSTERKGWVEDETGATWVWDIWGQLTLEILTLVPCTLSFWVYESIQWSIPRFLNISPE